jgi:predicted secreted protein
MNWFSALVVWLIIWWLVLFIILPIGIRGQAEEGDIVKGSEPGAPHTLNIKRKFIQTTIIASVLWVLTCGLILSGWVSWEMLGDFIQR